MSQTSASMASTACGDGGNLDLGASLLRSSTSKYNKIWRKSYYIGILISLKKSSTAGESPPPSPPYSSLPYTTLPPDFEPPATVPSRAFSYRSSVTIEIASDTEEEKEEDVERRSPNEVARIVKERDLELLLELGDHLGQLPENGSHRVLPVHGTSFSSLLWNSCKRNRFTISMLLFSAGLSFATEFKEEGPRYGWHDGVAIVIAIVLLVAFPSMANFWRERAMMRRSKRKENLKFKVQRGEEESLVAISDIVVGDIVYLRKGGEVPADGLLLDDDNFVLSEARSRSDRESNSLLLAGSKVIEGHRKMLVTSLGNRTIQSSMSCDYERRGLLERRIEKPISYVENFALSISVLVAIVVLIRLVCGKDGDSGGLPDSKGKVSVELLMETLERIFFRPQGRISILTGLVTVAILCIQHGMPLAITISLNYKIDKVVPNQDAVLNDLSACTTMGLVTVICIDVSGGLVSKPMEVSSFWMGEKDIISMVEGSEVDQVVLEELREGVGLSVLASEHPLSPMSSSLISWAETTWGMDMKSFTEEYNILERRNLNCDKEGNGILVRKAGNNEQVLHLHWSGAASTVLDMCSLYYDCKGGCHAMENQKIKFGEVIKEMEDSGLEPIAFAHKQTEVQELEQDELILLGLIGLKHNCSQELTKLAFEYLRNTEIQIKLVSEDDIMAVKGIASELGIEEPANGIVLEGKELQDLNDSAKLEKVDLAFIMGSFSPEDMLLMVECLQKKGQVVAFVGRRTVAKTSHASVLQVADVGIVQNSLGTIVDNQSSGITLKCFSALKPIVSAGRSNYYNIQKFIQIQLTFGISGSLITLIATISTGGSPLTAFQLIWVNVLMCHLGGIMMIMQLNSEEFGKACHRNQSIVTKEIWKSVVIQVLYQTSASMILEFGGHVTDIEKEVSKSMIFNTFLLCQVFNLLNTMQLLRREVLKIVLQSYYFFVALAFCFLLQVLVIEYAKGLANCTRLNAPRWAICVMIGVLSCAFECACKTLSVILSSTNNYASESNTSSSFGSSGRSRWPNIYWGFPFLILLLFPTQITFDRMGQTF